MKLVNQVKDELVSFWEFQKRLYKGTTLAEVIAMFILLTMFLCVCFGFGALLNWLI